MPIQQSGFDDFDRRMSGAAEGQVHELELANVAPYARYLNDREGFFVLNADHLEAEVHAALQEVAGAFEGPLTSDQIQHGLEYAARREINYLTEVTDKLAPPVRSKEGMRRAHHGNWADRKSRLVRSFRFKKRRLRGTGGGGDAA